MLEPLVAKQEFQRRFDVDDVSREAWRSLAEEPIGRAIERYLQDDLVRGLVLTDAKIGVFTYPARSIPRPETLFFITLSAIRRGNGNARGRDGQCPAKELEQSATSAGTEIVTGVTLRALNVTEIGAKWTLKSPERNNPSKRGSSQ